MSTTDSDFVATGPTLKGFETAVSEPPNITFGVNVRGKKCGVYGESVRRSRRNPPPPVSESDGLGVCGVGDSIGVMGDGGSIAGVFGQITEGGSNAAGVMGIGQKDGITGVIGVSTDPSRRGRGRNRGIGVIGASDNGSGFGVVGLSIESTDNSPIPIHNTSEATGIGTGVMGASGSGNGVVGNSESGTGVVGSSKRGRGGVFQSGKNVAQIRLMPQKQKSITPKLPREGKVGDLILLRNPSPFSSFVHRHSNETCSLWLCVPKDASDFSDQWQQVLLGPVITGTV